jgi:hypothetical protein
MNIAGNLQDLQAIEYLLRSLLVRLDGGYRFQPEIVVVLSILNKSPKFGQVGKYIKSQHLDCSFYVCLRRLFQSSMIGDIVVNPLLPFQITFP